MAHPQRRTTDRPTWKWLVTVLLALLISAGGVMYGAVANQLDDNSKDIVELKEAWSEVRTHLLYIRETLTKIENALEKEGAARVSYRYAE